MPEEWLIDGYNLLYGLKNRKNKKSTVTRESLLHALANFASASGRRVRMVLDGQGEDAEWQPFQTPELQILYSQAVSADSYIEKYLCENKGICRLVVVTRDQAITRVARGFGASVLDTEKFTGMLSEFEKESGDALFKHQVKAHGFHRPFEGKL